MVVCYGDRFPQHVCFPWQLSGGEGRSPWRSAAVAARELLSVCGVRASGAYWRTPDDHSKGGERVVGRREYGTPSVNTQNLMKYIYITQIFRLGSSSDEY